MPIDNTSLFRARVKTIQMRQQAALAKQHAVELTANGEKIVTASDHFNVSNSDPSSNRTALTSTSNSNFFLHDKLAKEIRSSLTELRDAIISRRQDYIAAIGHCNGFALSTSKGMSEWERKEMDDKTELAMRHCSQLIHSFQRQIQVDKKLRKADELAHFVEVSKILDNYFKKICKMITDLRSVHVRKTATMKKMTRLSALVQMYEAEKQKQQSLSGNYESDNNGHRRDNDGNIAESSSTTKLSIKPYSATFSSTAANVRQRRKKTNDGDHRQPATVNVSGWNEYDDECSRVTTDDKLQSSIENVEGLSEQQNIQLIAENEKLYSKLIQVDSYILGIEKQMNQLHELQETFAEKVLDQERDISLVNETAVHTVENIREGNEQIRKAIQNMASRRVILLFCIIVLTFTLLFLDWYNP